MSERGRPTLCLSMIVRDEAHLVRDALDCAVPHIDYWVAVDAGSTDSTSETLESYMAATGLPGEVHRRPWRDFATNRNEAVRLCTGKADYIWLLDAHDVVVGALDLGRLEADAYLLRYGNQVRHWRPRLLRSGLPWRFVGAAHAWLECDRMVNASRLEGNYYIDSRREPAAERERANAEVNARLLREHVRQHPDDAHAAFFLAQSYFDAGDHAQALEWYGRRVEMGGWDEEIFHSLLRGAACLRELGAEWAEILHNYLRAWQLRPDRAEPAYEVALHYGMGGRFELAELFARRAVEIPFPLDDLLHVDAEVYSWQAADELALSTYYTGGGAESFELWRSLLDTPGLPDHARSRIETNAHYCVPRLLNDRLEYPRVLAEGLSDPMASSPDEDSRVTLTIACLDSELLQRTINSFLNCCTDLHRICRWVCLDMARDAEAQRLRSLYRFVEFIEQDPGRTTQAEALNLLAGTVCTPLWLHLEEAREFFWQGPYVGRAVEILEAEPEVGQVAFNRNYAGTLAEREIVGGQVRHSPAGWRYLLHEYIEAGTAEWERHLSAMTPGSLTMAHWPHFTLRPSVLRTKDIQTVGRFDATAESFEHDFAVRYANSGLRTAFFDAINYRHTSPLTRLGSPLTAVRDDDGVLDPAG